MFSIAEDPIQAQRRIGSYGACRRCSVKVRVQPPAMKVQADRRWYWRIASRRGKETAQGYTPRHRLPGCEGSGVRFPERLPNPLTLYACLLPEKVQRIIEPHRVP